MPLGLKIFFKTGLEQGAAHAGERPAVGGRTLRELASRAREGLVASFAVGAGVLAAAGNPRTALFAGLALLVGGAVAAGLEAVLASRRERARPGKAGQQEEYEIISFPETGGSEVRSILEKRGYSGAALDLLPGRAGAEPVAPVRAGLGAGLAYGFGAAIPALPFALLAGPALALASSAALSLAALFGVGAVKARAGGRGFWIGGLESALVGACAGAASFWVGRLLAG